MKIPTTSPDRFLESTAQNAGLKLVHFASPLFTGCRYVRRQLERLAGELGDELEFEEVELELTNSEFIHAIGLRQLPTLSLFVRDREIERFEELLAPDELDHLLRDCLAFYGPANAETGEPREFRDAAMSATDRSRRERGTEFPDPDSERDGMERDGSPRREESSEET